MQLNITTDYAIRAILLLALKDERLSISTISDSMKIPRSYLPSIMKKLGARGLVSVERGVTGGWKLEIPAEAISLFDIIDTMEGTTRINRCLEPDHACNRTDPNHCAVHHQYRRLQDTIDRSLKDVTIQQLITETVRSHPDPTAALATQGP